MSAYLVAIGSVALIYVLLGLGLNLHWGHAGLLNFGHVAFFAIGAYTAALLTLHGVNAWLAVAASAVTASAAALAVGVLTIRLKEDYLAIVTLALAEIVRLVLVNGSWSGGPSGLTGIPPPFTDASGRPTQTPFLVLVGVTTVVALLALWRLTNSSFGLSLQAIRDNETAALALGKSALGFKTRALVLGAALAGIAGAFYAYYVAYVVPDQFMALVTFYLWVGIILGGSSHIGAALGTFVFVALEEATRFASDLGLPVSDAQMARIRLLAIGVALVLLIRLRPQGFLPNKRRVRRELGAVALDRPVPEAVEVEPQPGGVRG